MRRRLVLLGLIASAWVSGGCTRELSVFTPRSEGQLDAGPLPGDAGDGSTSDAGDATVPAPEPSVASSIAAFAHTCVVSNGRLACWGENQGLQLGVGDREPRSTAVWTAEFDDFVQVCAGEAHSCALRGDGPLFCWGENLHGELGVGDSDPRDRPTRVGSTAFVRVACGGNASCAIAPDGALFCWGDNFEGQMGQGDPFRSPNHPRPVRVAPTLSFRDVSVGQGHVCAVTNNGELYCWGRNTTKQLGTGLDDEQLRTPTRVDRGQLYRAVAAGMSHSCAIARDGRLFCWGADSSGSLGLGTSEETEVPLPAQVSTDADYRSVRASWFHTCAVRGNGVLVCFGRNTEGQLGVSDTTQRNVPTRVGSDTQWTEVTTGQFHTCGIREGAVYCWGENDERNQLGLGAPGRRSEPTAVSLPPP
jgi:alpha-tubulin suppressor-like RCC1 family protein